MPALTGASASCCVFEQRAAQKLNEQPLNKARHGLHSTAQHSSQAHCRRQAWSKHGWSAQLFTIKGQLLANGEHIFSPLAMLLCQWGKWGTYC